MRWPLNKSIIKAVNKRLHRPTRCYICSFFWFQKEERVTFCPNRSLTLHPRPSLSLTLSNAAAISLSWKTRAVLLALPRLCPQPSSQRRQSVWRFPNTRETWCRSWRSWDRNCHSISRRPATAASRSAGRKSLRQVKNFDNMEQEVMCGQDCLMTLFLESNLQLKQPSQAYSCIHGFFLSLLTMLQKKSRA